MNPESIRAKLLNIAKERNIFFQELLNRFSGEQFLARLSESSYANKFIFKGGGLLAYLIDSGRKTRDLDFSVRNVSHEVGRIVVVIREILSIPIEDGLTWETPDGQPLSHPAMDYPGARLKCRFNLGTAKGMVRMDLAMGDEVDAVKRPLKRIRYKDRPLVGPDFDLLIYPPEAIFSEKLQIALHREKKNTRMKDYYDLFQLAQLAALDPALVKRSIQKTFAKRDMEVQHSMDFSSDALEQLQQYWAAFIRKMKISDVPDQIGDVIMAINKKLKEIHET